MARKKNFKSLLTELDGLQGLSGAAAYKRVTLAVEIYDDPEFKEQAAFGNEKTMLEILDGKFQDFLLFAADRQSPFLKLRRILDVFPKLEDWKNGDLHGLYQKVAVLGRSGEQEEAPQRPRNGVTIKEHAEVCDDRDHFKARCNYLEGRVATLEVENSESRQREAVLLGRVEELEKLLSRDMAAA